MNILFITTFFPYPPDEGIKMPIYNLIKKFCSLGHNLIVVSFIKKEEKQYLPELEKFCERFVAVDSKVSKNFVIRIFHILLSNEPFNIYQFYSKNLLYNLDKVLSEEKIDIIFFDFFTTVKYREKINISIPTILHYYDAVSMLFYRNFLNEKNLVKKIYWYNQYKKLVKFEHKIQQWFNKIIVVAEKDKQWLVEKSKVEPSKIKVIPNGVDTKYFYYKFDKNFVEEPFSLLFRGIMNFKPNIDACLYFLKHIWPLIKSKLPQVKFYIVGPNPPKKILRYPSKDKNIVVTGYVEDIREYIVKSKINICPMISGSGIKNKILESLSMGVPSVVTPIAAEGIPELKDYENVLIADTPQEFAKKVVLLFEDENLYKKLAYNGRKLVEEKYTWDKIVAKFYQIFDEIILSRSAE